MKLDEWPGLSVDDALRLGLSPLNMDDINLLTDNNLVADAAEQLLRCDHVARTTTSNYYQPL